MRTKDLIQKFGWTVMPYLSNLGVNLLADSDVFFVDSEHTDATDDGDHGYSFEHPFATANYAMDQCTSGQGDVVLLAPGHAETLDDLGTASSDNNTDELVMDKTGVSLIGVGQGTLRPTFTCGSADATAGINVTAANCRISNIRVISGMADLAAGITIGASADGSIVENCTIRDGGTAGTEMVIGILVTADADRCIIRNNVFSTVASGDCANAIKLAGGMDEGIIEGNIAFGTYSTGCLLGGAASTNLTIKDNIFVNAGAAIAIALHTSTTGILCGNKLGGYGSTVAAVLTGDNALWCFENYVLDAVALSGMLNPAAVTS